MSDGKDYELFVQKLQQALINSEGCFSVKNINVEKNKKLTDSCGCTREFDLYWEYEFGGVTYKTVIECKDYSSKVTIEKIDALIGKVRDFPGLKPVFATRMGYQSGAEKKARSNNIELLIVREQNESDWKNERGESYLREIHINTSICGITKIISFTPTIDGRWALENSDVDMNNPPIFSGNTGQIVINDMDKSERFSLHTLLEALTAEFNKNKQFGVHVKKYVYTNAFLETPANKLKMSAFEIAFELLPPHSDGVIIIDLTAQLVGVIEYLEHHSKTAIFKNRVIKNWRSTRN